MENIEEYDGRKGFFIISELFTRGGTRFSTEGDSDYYIYWDATRECYVVELSRDGYIATRWFIQLDAVDYIREDWEENGDEQ